MAQNISPSSVRLLDRQALAELHDQYYPAIYRYVSFRIQDAQVCEDITSEVFVRLIEALFSKKSQINDMRAWLFGTASNLVNDHFRLQYRRPVVNLDEQSDLPSLESTERSVDHTLNLQKLQSAVQLLTPEQQTVLALRFSQDLSLEETAAAMSKSINAIKVLQFRALASLRRLVEDRNSL